MALYNQDLKQLKNQLPDSIDLVLCTEKSEDRFNCNIIYNTSLFNLSTIERMSKHYLLLLEGIAEDMNKAINAYPIVPESELEFIDTRLTKTQEHVKLRCLHQFFEDRVAATPGRIGLIFEGTRLTYREMNERANVISHKLISLGIGPNKPVGLFVDRSIEFVVSMLGILKAGGYYMAMDPDYPDHRLNFLLEDAKCSVILTLGDASARLCPDSSKFDKPPVFLDVSSSEFDVVNASELNKANPNVEGVNLETVACIIYTSGSTGTPKGLLVPHKGPSNFVLATQLETPVGSEHVMMQQATLGFDMHMQEMNQAYLAGCPLVMPMPGGHKDIYYLSELIKRERVTHFGITPSKLSAMLDLPNIRANMETVKCIWVGGEPLTAALKNKYYTTLPGAELYNSYGPAETSLAVTLWDCSDPNYRDSAITPLGHPLKNVKIYVLDKHLNKVPIGVAGECCISGVGVTYGYYNNPEKTSASFVPNPFSDGVTDKIMYKSGDLVRLLADGNLEYFGREDFQVKIRGFRVELGEIEATIALYPGIANTAVIVREDDKNIKRLIAYISLNEPTQNTTFKKQLYLSLKEKLPNHMVPSAIVLVTKFALTPSGKIDRKLLPLHSSYDYVSDAEYVAPTTTVEKQLAAIWADVLHLDQVGIHSNFFELGGDSLLVVKVINLIRKQIPGADLKLKYFYANPTIAQLSTACAPNSASSKYTIENVPRDKPLPLTYEQQRLWFLDQLHPNSAFYNIPTILRFKGEFDASLLERAFLAILDRHESLRTIFLNVNGSPVQRIIPTSEAGFQLVQITIDSSSLSEQEVHIQIKERVRQEIMKPFELHKGPLTRALLVSVRPSPTFPEGEYVLVTTVHHIISDGWSEMLFLRELSKHYESLQTTGTIASLPPLSIQYADYSFWQQTKLQDTIESQMPFWREKLKGELPVLQLPLDKPRPKMQTYEGGNYFATLDPKFAERLEGVFKQNGVTNFVGFLAAYFVVLHRYTRQDDIIIGTALSGRPSTELEEMIGFFVNSLPVRVDVGENPSFKHLLERVKATSLEILANQDVPFDRLVKEFVKERDVSRNPLFQAMLVYNSTTISEVSHLKGTTLLPVEDLQEMTISKFDITVSVFKTTDSFSFLFEYNTSLFNPSTIDRMYQHYLLILEGIVDNVDNVINAYPMVPESELGFIDKCLTKTETPVNLRCLHQFFEDRVAATPDSVGLIFEGTRLTYREMNERANVISHKLISLGIGPNKPVGLFVDRSIEFVVSMLGILKAGGYYMAMDPDYPDHRLNFLLEDAKCSVVLTLGDASARLCPDSSKFDKPPVFLDVSSSEFDVANASEASKANPNVEGVNLETVACIIYTSGSTGTPKGLLVPHRGPSNFVLVTQLETPVGPDHVMMQQATLGFDMHMQEMNQAYLAGCPLVMPMPGGHKDIYYLSELIKRERVTHFGITPSKLSAMLDLPNIKASLETVKCIWIGGEPLTAALRNKYFSVLPGAELHNSYGPAETSLAVTLWDCSDPNYRDSLITPLGHPLKNVKIYVLDKYLNKVPIGVAGECCISGVGVTYGYYNNPEKTSASFVPNPFSDGVTDKIMYKSGDLVRLLADGNLEYFGREDFQVKIRGFRVELGEIEATIALYPGIANTAVIVREDDKKVKRLVAYISLKEDLVDVTSFKKQLYLSLKEKLPNHMVPSAIVLVTKFALTPSGKIDRKLLPLHRSSDYVSDAEYVAPTTTVEKQLAAIWADVLHLDQVGVHSNFFELGGDSLLVVKVINLIRKQFPGIDLKLKYFYANPTIADLALFINSSSSSPVVRETPITTVDRSTDLVLSFEQQRLWFLDQLNPGSAFYNIPHVARFSGEIQVEILEKSLLQLIQRHESLRTQFIMKNGVPFQKILNPSEVSFSSKVIDLQGKVDLLLPQVKFIVLTESNAPFVLNACPLLRCTVIRLLDANEAVLIVTMHHIVSDGWSFSVFMNELSTVYNALLDSSEPQLPSLAVQYPDYSTWQRTVLEPSIQDQLAFWRTKLRGELPNLQMPTDFVRPSMQTYDGKVVRFTIPPELLASLHTLFAQRGLTMYMGFLATFTVLLHRYSRQEDIIVGTVTSGRHRPELEQIIGFFVNTIPLRMQFAGDAKLYDFFDTVRTVCTEAFSNQEVPFDHLVSEFVRERDTSRNPIFQVMFTYTSDIAPAKFKNLLPLPLNELGDVNTSAKFDLTADLLESNNTLEFILEYNTSLYKESTIKHLGEQWVKLMERISAAGNVSLSNLSILTDDDYLNIKLMLQNPMQFNDSHLCIHQLVEQQANKTPDQVALIFEDEQLTYQQFNDRANIVAHKLIELGVKPETIVGVFIDRSLELFIAILGILKAGAAYEPMDLEYPDQRLQYMIQDTQTRIVLSNGKHHSRLQADAAKLQILDITQPNFQTGDTTNPVVPQLTNSNLAVVFYTSGSTGEPKGVLLQHAGIVNQCLAVLHSVHQMTPQDRMIQQSSIGFDVSLEETFTTLFVGATLVLCRPDGQKDVQYVLETISKHSVTRIESSPSKMQVILDHPNAQFLLKSLQTAVVGGEVCTITLRQQFASLVPSATLWNLYGPTEASINTTYYNCNDLPKSNDSVPIGRPAPNYKLFVLDKYLCQVPIGVPGELFVSGPGIARGYLNKPEKTKSVFLPNPFSESYDDKFIYRTGDLVRLLPDGMLEYIGREDFQVKIRGFRVELGEIEAAILQHPKAKECLVLVKVQDQVKKLVAYVRVSDLKDQKNQIISELSARLKDQLPPYMVPSFFVLMEQFPLNANEKVDRRALPAPTSQDAVGDSDFVEPSTDIEKDIAETWKSLLNLDKVGIHANFFELGGDSLLVVRVINALRLKHQRAISVKEFYARPTIYTLSQLLTTPAEPERQLPEIVLVDRHEQFPLSFEQERLWFLDQLNPNSSFYNMPRVFRIAGKVKAKTLNRAFDVLIRRHEILRTEFQISDGVPSQQIYVYSESSSSFELKTTKLKGVFKPGTVLWAQVKTLINDEVSSSFQLDRGNLLRAILIKLQKEENESIQHESILVINMHHIITDAWSEELMVRELSAHYQSILKTGQSIIKSPPIQYADYSHWQRNQLESIIKEEMNFWKTKLSGELPVLQIPTDKPRPNTQSFDGANMQLTVPADLTKKLQSLFKSRGVTMYNGLLTAFLVLLWRYSGQDDIMIGTITSGRDIPGVYDMLGFFVNTLPIRVDLANNPSFGELLARVKDTCAQTFANQHVPFNKLVSEFVKERDASRNPLFQVMFSYESSSMSNDMNQEFKFLDQEELPLFDLGGDFVTTKFDLSVDMTENGDTIGLYIEYSTSIFLPSTIERMGAQMLVLLNDITQSTETPISSLQFLSAQDNQILSNHLYNLVDLPHKDKCIHHLFEHSEQLHPNHIAVIFGDQQRTYSEINEQANVLAHKLIHLGVTPDTPVGLFMDRCLELIIAILGIMKAGGAYVPMDPEYPDHRLNYMIEDTQLAIVLTCGEAISRLSPDPSKYTKNLTVVDLKDKKWTELSSNESVTNPNIPGLTNHNLAYIMYTSGSTGMPKGVLMPHKGPVNQVVWLLQHTSKMQHFHKELQQTSIGFDNSVAEIYTTWVAGATLILPKPEGHRDIQYLLELIQAHQITHMEVTPSKLQTMMDEPIAKDCMTSLIYVSVGGEACNPALKNQFYSLMPQAVLWNSYGPTEAAVNTTLFNTSDPEYLNKNIVPIGKPVANYKLYVLDKQHKQVPVGVIGELYVSGVGIARGYLNKPDKTSAAFFVNPYSTGAEDKMMYRTGDLVRMLPDGNLDYLGREDFQVKIRGVRIELGEIETVLSQNTSVKESVVVVWTDEHKNKRLVAYIRLEESSEDKDSIVKGIRSALVQSLPLFMVPSFFITVDVFPLNSSGKIDRKALRAPTTADMISEDDFMPPCTPLEETLVQIWKDLLGLDKIGVNASFFALGGDSILATKFVNALRTKFPNRRFSVRNFFQAPTVSNVANLLNQDAPVSMLSFQQSPGERLRSPSFEQQRMFYMDQLNPNTPYHNMPTIWRFSGQLYEDYLEEAFIQIVERHETLRTIFTNKDGAPVQTVVPASQTQFRLKRHRLSGRLEEGTEMWHQVKSMVIREALKHFALDKAPLIRASLWVIQDEDPESDREYILLVNVHHIVSDGWSDTVIATELAEHYDALVHTGMPAQLQPLPIQYSDYAHWQRSHYASVKEEQFKFWKKQLGGDLPMLASPTDFPRNVAPTTKEGAEFSFKISADLTSKLKYIFQQADTTLNLGLFASFVTLLYRETGQQDIFVGTYHSGRNSPELELLIGYFVHILPIRFDLQDNPKFFDLLAQVKNNVLEAFENDDTPLEHLITEFGKDRDSRRHPLFQTLFVLDAIPDHQFISLLKGKHNLKVLPHEDLDEGAWIFATYNKLDYGMRMVEVDGGIKGTWYYDSSLFTQETMARFSKHWGKLLEHIASTPSIRVSDIPILTQEEEALSQYHEIDYDGADMACLHYWFENQVKKTPDQPALVFEETTLTYADLNQQANSIAHLLMLLGVGADVPVVIYMDKSIEMIVSILATLKAGGAYIPIELDAPIEVVQYIIQDAKPKLVLTQPKFPAYTLFEDTPFSVFYIDRNATSITDQKGELIKLPANTQNPERKVKPQNLAYILYNAEVSAPNGIMVPHQAPINMLYYLHSNYPLTTTDCILQNISISFDPSVMQIFWAFMSGAKLVVPMPNGHNQYLVNAIQQHKVTVLCFVPTMFEEYLSMPNIANYFESVKLIMFGGSILKQTLRTRILETFQGRKDLTLLNSYGPAEAGIVVSIFDMQGDVSTESKVPIGKPIPNMAMLILDDHLGHVPVGTASRLYLAGVGVASGYFNKPEATHRHFIPNPHSRGVKDKMLFKTGDLAVALPDGNIKFIGKEESLYKTSGYSIEMSDIEAAICEHHHIHACYVTPNKQKKQLIAYVILDQVYNNEKQAFILNDLKLFLKSKLPVYMIPYFFLPIQSFPLTSNGKVDKKALPKPTQDILIRQSSLQSALNEIEQIVTDIWKVTLRVDVILPDSNFFQLGGDSLSAVRLLRDISAKFEVPSIRLHEFYGEPTVSAISKWVLNAKNTAQAPYTIPSAPISATTPVSYEQQVAFEFENLTGPGYSQNAQVIRFTGDLSVKHLEEAINATIRRHESLRSIVQKTNNNTYQLNIQKPNVNIKIAVQKLSWFSSDIREGTAVWLALKAMVDKELLTPIPIDKAPLMRVALFTTRKPLSAYVFKSQEIQQHILVINIHPIAADSWSAKIIATEIGANYESLIKSGKPAALPILPIHFRDYTHWQRNVLPSYAASSRAFWKNKLSGKLPILQFPLHLYRRLATPTNYAAGVVRFKIPEQLVMKLRNILTQRGDTLFMGLFTVWTILLHQYTMQKDIIVGLETGGRIHPQVDDLVGQFAHMVPIRVNFSGNPRFLNMINDVKDLCIEAFANDIPMGLILESVSELESSRHPLFQTAVTYSKPQADNFTTRLAQFRSLPIHDLKDKYNDHKVLPFDLQISFMETDTEIDAAILYNKNLFDIAIIQQFVEYMKALLKSVSTAAHVSISNLPNPLEVLEEQAKKSNSNPRRVSFSNVPNPYLEEQSRRARGAVYYAPNQLAEEEDLSKRTRRLTQ